MRELRALFRYHFRFMSCLGLSFLLINFFNLWWFLCFDLVLIWFLQVPVLPLRLVGLDPAGLLGVHYCLPLLQTVLLGLPRQLLDHTVLQLVQNYHSACCRRLWIGRHSLDKIDHLHHHLETPGHPHLVPLKDHPM